MTGEWKDIWLGVIDTNAELFQRISEQDGMFKPEVQVAMRQINRNLRKDVADEVELTPAKLYILAQYCSTALAAYQARMATLTKVCDLCKLMKEKVEKAAMAEKCGEQFAAEFSEKFPE